jgi:hypothetical protein
MVYDSCSKAEHGWLEYALVDQKHNSAFGLLDLSGVGYPAAHILKRERSEGGAISV